jgi:hypothetical protein
VVAVEGGQTPFVIVHVNVFKPGRRFPTAVVAAPGVVTVAPEAGPFHIPLPIAGIFAITELVSEQTVCEAAATAVLGNWSLTT